MSWKPEVKVTNEEAWHSNALRFATKDEAERNAKALAMRWTLVEDWRATESEDPVKNVYTMDGKLMPLKEGQF